MTQRRRKLINVFAAANTCGFEVPEKRPPKDDKVAKAEAMRGIRAFYMAIGRGAAPRAFCKVSGRNRWDEQEVQDFMEAQRKKGQKKADDCANSHQRIASHPTKSRGAKSLSHLTRNVNANDEGAGHG